MSTMESMFSAVRPPRSSILYVDDDALACRHVSLTIGADYEVLTANSAHDAMNLLSSDDHDVAVLVTDFRMPVLDGGDLLREVAREFPQIVRMLVTAHADREVLMKTVNAGDVFRVMEKPLRRNELMESLRQAIERYHERAMHFRQLRAVGDTLAFVAHELNTPLSTISLIAEASEARLGEHSDPSDSEGIVHSMATIRRNAQYCMTLVMSFWQSLCNGGERLPRSAAAGRSTARDLIADLLDTYPFAGRQRGWVHVDMRSDFVVHKQVSSIALVLSSILSNGLRALEDVDTPSLSIVVVTEPEPSIQMIDNGPGIPPSIAERLLADPITTETGGHGLGMLFCKRVMQSMGGRIEIGSRPGGGATIALIFPAGRPRSRVPDGNVCLMHKR